VGVPQPLAAAPNDRSQGCSQDGGGIGHDGSIESCVGERTMCAIKFSSLLLIPPIPTPLSLTSDLDSECSVRLSLDLGCRCGG
jgi:hypothetical protein